MKFPPSSRRNRLLLGGSLVATALLSAVRLGERDPIPWAWVAVFAVGTFLLAGPIRGTLRSRLSEERREGTAVVAFGAISLCLPVVLGLGLVFGYLSLIFDAGALRGIVGLAVAILTERTVVPEHLRARHRDRSITRTSDTSPKPLPRFGQTS